MWYDIDADHNDFNEERSDRYCTWAEAEAGHARMVAEVRAAILASRPQPRVPPEPVPLRSGARRLDIED